MRSRSVPLMAILLTLCVVALVSQENGLEGRPIVIRAKTIYTITNGVIENGMILIEQGRIKSVAKKIEIPPKAVVYTAEVVMPGMIDAHVHFALDRSSRPAGPVTAEWKGVEHLDLEDGSIKEALAGGVTSVITRPGSGVISSGQAVALKLRRYPDENMILKPFVDLKMAVRPLIKLRPGETPATVMGWYATASDYFQRAQEYLERQNKTRGDLIPVAQEKDERLEAFAAVLRGDAMVHIHCHYPNEIMMVLRLARKFDFIDNLSLGHAGEAHVIADQLAETDVVSVVGPVTIVRFLGDQVSHNVVKYLMEAGAKVSIQSDQSGEHLRDFREYGAFLVRHGLRRDHALQALTINGARAMMLSDRIGSIEEGKDADLVLLDGDPFDLTADRVERVIVDGIVEYERDKVLQSDRLTRVGPFGPIQGEEHLTHSNFAITNAQIFTVSKGIIRRGTLVINDGKFSRVDEEPYVPDGVPVIDVGGRVVMPGWITARAFPNDWIGDIKWQVQNDELVDMIAPHMNARFGIDPWFPSFSVLRGIGITTQQITPGHTNLIGGSGVVIKTAGMEIGGMIKREPSSSVFSLAKESLNHWSRDLKSPLTLSEASARIRETLDASLRLMKKDDASSGPSSLEALFPVLRREIPVIIHAKNVDEIKEALQIAKDYKLRLIISGAVQAHELPEELAKARVGVILGDSASRLEDIRGGGEGFNAQSAAILNRHGVKVSFFGPSASRRGMPTGRLGGEPALNAAWVFRNGVPEADAIKMMTLGAAEMLGMDKEVGSIEVGKDADFIVMKGHPFDYRVLPEMVFVNGRLIHQGSF